LSARDEIAAQVESLPTMWDGKNCVLQMREGGDKWRQTEWPGWYFHHWMKTVLDKKIIETPGPKIGATSFFGFGDGVPWTLRTHALNAQAWGARYRLPAPEHSVILYDTDATEAALAAFGRIGVVILCGEAVWDSSGSFRRWHNALKGEESSFEIDRKKRGAPSRHRKRAFILKGFLIFFLSPEGLSKCGSFQKGLRNKDGAPRRSKVTITLGDYREHYKKLTKRGE